MLPIIFSSLIFAACLGMVFSEKLNRTIIALAGDIWVLGHREDGTEKWTGMQWFDTRADCQRVTSGTGTCDECACM